MIGTAIQGLEIILESCVFLVFNLCEIVLLAIEEEEEEERQLWLKMVTRDPINRTCPCNSLVRKGFDFFFFNVPRLLGQQQRQGFPCFCHLGSSLSVHACYPRGILTAYWACRVFNRSGD